MVAAKCDLKPFSACLMARFRQESGILMYTWGFLICEQGRSFFLLVVLQIPTQRPILVLRSCC